MQAALAAVETPSLDAEKPVGFGALFVYAISIVVLALIAAWAFISNLAFTAAS